MYVVQIDIGMVAVVGLGLIAFCVMCKVSSVLIITAFDVIKLVVDDIRFALKRRNP